MLENRILKLQQILKEKSLDCLLVTNFYNIVYLTEFSSLSKEEREAYVVVTQDPVYLITDARYIDEKLKVTCAKSKIRILTIDSNKRLSWHIQEVIKKDKIKILGFEAESLHYSEYTALQEKLPMVELKPTQELLVKQRAIKDSEEIKNISQACVLTDQCLKEIIPTITIGLYEKEIANRLHAWMRNNQSEAAFDPIIAVDHNAALPHYNTKTGNGIVKKGSLILIDFGIAYKNYISDITRIISIGTPSNDIVDSYEKLLNVQTHTIDAVSSVKQTKELDILCRKLLEQYSLPNFSHSTGHGVGLEVHEYPRISTLSNDTVQTGQVFTIEPGIYYEGKWGMRIEDTIYINENLKPVVLTKFPKQLVILS